MSFGCTRIGYNLFVYVYKVMDRLHVMHTQTSDGMFAHKVMDRLHVMHTQTCDVQGHVVARLSRFVHVLV